MTNVKCPGVGEKVFIKAQKPATLLRQDQKSRPGVRLNSRTGLMSGSKRLWSRDPTLHTNFSAFVCLHHVPRFLFLSLSPSPQARLCLIVYVKSVHLLPRAWVQHSCCCICSTNKSKFILCNMKKWRRKGRGGGWTRFKLFITLLITYLIIKAQKARKKFRWI